MRTKYKIALALFAIYFTYSIVVAGIALFPDGATHPLARMKNNSLRLVMLNTRLGNYNPIAWISRQYVYHLEQEEAGNFSESLSGAPLVSFYKALPSIEAKDEGVSEITKLRADLLNMPASNDPYLTVLSFDSIVYLTTKLEKTPSELGKLELIDRRKYASTLLQYSKEFLEYYANGMLEKRAEMLKEVHTDDADSSLKVERMAIRRYPENFLYAFESKMLPMKDLQKYQKQLSIICDGMKLNYPMPQSQNVVQECISQMNRLHSAAGAN